MLRIEKKILLTGTSFIVALFAANIANAQSTASTAMETVVVRGNKTVGIYKKEVGTKSRTVIDQELISKSTTGQSIAEILNTVPGYNFTNTDAYGSSGGNLRIRGMDGSRISLTVDGVQLNDSGNYAIFTNQQLEPELICSASVNTGATDVDSMSASASGGTVNYSTCKPDDKFGGVVKIAAGGSGFTNQFVKIDTGAIGPFGTKAFVSFTNQDYDTWTREIGLPGELKKKQANFRIFQDLFDNGSFVSLSGHYNENRNRTIFSNTKAVIYPTVLTENSGYEYNSALPFNVNPSDTGNVKIQSKFVINEKLFFTFDPTFQYVMATGGGTTTSLAENSAILCGAGFVASVTTCGVDLNNDGVVNSTSVTFYAPNLTNTHRVSLTSSGVYMPTDNHTFRLAVSLDRANHRQTGEGSRLNTKGTTTNTDDTPFDVFSGKEDEAIRLKAVDGKIYQRRNRFSEANVDVLSFEYKGKYLEDALSVSLGVRHQKMERNLNQYCYVQINGSGTVLCTTQPEVAPATAVTSDVKVVQFGTSSTQYFSPYSRTYSFEKTLPNVGATYRLNPEAQLFASYAETMSSPRTDSYYNAALIGGKLQAANPEIETSTNIELGYRYSTSKVLFVATVFDAKDKNRIVSSFDPETGSFLDRNVGDVDRKGYEGQFAYTPFKFLSFNASYTYTEAELQSNLIVARSVVTTGGVTTITPLTIATKGKMLVETPKNMMTFGLDYSFADQLFFNIQGKFVGDRFSTDINDDISPAYDIWNASLRYELSQFKKGTYIQLNVHNLFDTKYLGNITSRNNALATTRSDGATFAASLPSFNTGAPRTISAALRFAF